MGRLSLRGGTWISPLTLRIVTALLVLVVACAASASLAGWKLWNDARTEAHRDAQSLGVVLAEQTARALQAASLILRETHSDLEDAGVATPEAFRSALSTRAAHDEMIRRMKDLPQLAGWATIDDTGQMIGYGRGWPSPRLSFADRDYYSYCQANHGGESFISTAVSGRVSGVPVFNLVRCVAGSDGRLLGLLLVALKIDYFLDFYRSIALPAGSDLAVVRRDGTALIRYRQDSDAVVASSAAPPPEAATYVSIDLRTEYPLAIHVGVSPTFAAAKWRQQMLWIVFGSLCAMACSLIPLFKLVAVIGRFQSAQAELVERNDALTAAHRRLEGQARFLEQTAGALRESEGRLARQSAVLETTLEHMDQGLIMVTAERAVAVCNRRAMEMLDLPAELMQSRPQFSAVLAHQWQAEEFAFTPGDIKDFLRQGGMLDRPHTYERQRPNGVIVEICSIPLAGGGMVRTYTDITKRKQAEQRLTYVADHDALTGLVNRRVLRATLRSTLELVGPGATGVAVLYLDLDRFKLVNDTHGHAVGDHLLAEVARRMQGCVREGDLLARLGGDEFAAVLPAGAGREVAIALAERLKAEVSAPYELDGVLVRVGVSIGIALHGKDGTSAEALLRSADSALYRAKAAGRNTVCCHEIAAEQEDRGRLILEQDMRLALAAEQFELAYQPIFDIATGLPHSFEALLRWRHPTHGLLSPDRFVPIAEATGVINEIGSWVIRTACKEAATWALPVRLAINLSSVQFAQRDLEQQIVAALELSGLPADRLDLEVTETVLISDSDEVHRTMTALQQRGIRLVMDDFGTGHSSLKTLQRFPFQQIKIDRAFVADLHDEAGGGAIVRAMLTMAATMKLEVVAEGIETRVQSDILRGLGCQYMQGYLLAKPQTPAWTRDYLWRCTTAKIVDPCLFAETA